MKNILIVDDEPLIANGISTLVSNFDLDINNTYVMTDSEEALTICQQQEIDVIITDINMPNLNGLELIKSLKKTNKNLQIIILTGFASLTYAKEAMSLGVKFFLEKPVMPEQLLDAIKNSLVSSERRQVESKLYQKRQIEQFISSAGESSLPDSLTYPLCLYLFDSKFYDQLSKLIDFYPNRQQLIIGHHNKVGYIINNSHEDTFNIFIKKQLAQSFIGKGITIDCTINDEKEFLFYYKLGKRHLDKEFYFERFAVVHTKDLLNEKIYENQIYLEFREKLLQFLMQGEISNCKRIIEQFFKTCRIELYPVQLLRLQINDLLSTIMDLYPIKYDDYFDDYSPKIMLLNDWRELQFMMLHCLDLLGDSLPNTQNMKLSQKVNLIIEEYYNREDFSLKWIACHLLYLNPEYLGKTYYKETGVRFNKKLAEYRIQKAKKYLENNYKVYEVASMTGFENSPEYFIQTFKKITGVTPKQFVKTKESVVS